MIKWKYISARWIICLLLELFEGGFGNEMGERKMNILHND